MSLTLQKYYNKMNHKHHPNLIDCSNMQGKSVYFIGIGGVGMSAIAKILIDEGCFVSGSDLECSPITHNLEKLGAKINTNQDGKSIDQYTNLVIISAAIKENNPDLMKAKMLGLKVVKYSEFLGSLMSNKRGIAVSGTHGKTTTGAMISTILKKTGCEPTFVIGGDVEGIGGGSCVGKGNLFVAEACEYDRTFLNLSPQIGVITNIDEDHLDCYKDINGVTNAFSEFASLIPEDGLLVVNSNDENIREAIKSARCRVEKYSVIMASSKHLPDYVVRAGKASMLKSALLNTASKPLVDASHSSACYYESDTTWLAVVHYFDKEMSLFSVFNEGKYFGEFSLKMPGFHNVSNALAAISVCSCVGLNEEVIKKALVSFKGVRRRFQTISSKDGITIIDDYAHHPTEIRMTLETAKLVYPSKRLWCIFQPHQYNRTRHLLEEFAKALTLADKVIITDIYAARDSDIDRASVRSLNLVHELLKMGSDVKYIEGFSEIVSYLHLDVKRDDVVLIMGAGDIWKIAYELENNLEAHDLSVH
ncbi:MAG: UDP-N-acetylmuramate--L-alanine ligase [Candidatus Scalindua sediminis]